MNIKEMIDRAFTLKKRIARDEKELKPMKAKLKETAVKKKVYVLEGEKAAVTFGTHGQITVPYDKAVKALTDAGVPKSRHGEYFKPLNEKLKAALGESKFDSIATYDLDHHGKQYYKKR